jgi:hypothetical protein
LLLDGFGLLCLVFGSTGEALVKLSFHLVIKLDAHDPATTAFDLVAGLVIETIELRIVESFLGLLQSVVGGLILGDNPTPRQKLVNVTTWIGLCSVSAIPVFRIRPCRTRLSTSFSMRDR